MASVNLVFRDNGFGLSRDFRLLAAALRRQGCDVAITALGAEQERWRRSKRIRTYVRAQRFVHRMGLRVRPPRQFDLNVMFEHIWPDRLLHARRNVTLPNPEWFDRRDLRYLSQIDAVWAKSSHALGIFEQLGCHALRLGFDSEDRFDPTVRRERSFFHLAGASRTKGTRRLIELWSRHPEWPTLTVLQDPREAWPAARAPNIRHRIEYLDPAQTAQFRELKRLQNQHAFHACTSETDAWGHYLVEALGVGAVTMTVDAPPMNELVTPERGLLVPYCKTEPMALATRYFFDEAAMADTVRRAIALSDAEIATLRERARAWYDDNRRAFVRRVGAALESTLQ